MSTTAMPRWRPGQAQARAEVDRNREHTGRAGRFCTAAAVVAMLAASITGCGSDRSASEKSGGGSPPVTLPLGTVAGASTSAGSAVEVEAFPGGVYRAEVKNVPYASGKTLVTLFTFVDGGWRAHDDSGQGDCMGTYVAESGRIQITTSTEEALACGNPPARVFLDAAWTFGDGQLHFSDVKSDANAVYVFGAQPWTKIS